MEHRLSERIPCDLQVHVRFRDQELDGCRILNAAAEGVLLECPGQEIPPGHGLEIALPDPEGKGAPLWVWGLVVHNAGERAGVFFGPISGTAHHFIEALCHHHLEVPPPARRN